MSVENYPKTNWYAGDVITTHKLNKIEQAIADISEEIIDARTNNKSDSSTLGARIDDMIKVGDTLKPNTEIWINRDSNEYIEVPTIEDLNKTVNNKATEVEDRINQRINNTIIVSSSESDLTPQTEIWVRPAGDGEEYEIPSQAEFEALAARVDNLDGGTGSGASDNLINRVSAAESNITALQQNKANASDVSAISSEVQTARNGAANLNTRLTNIESSINNLDVSSQINTAITPIEEEIENARGTGNSSLSDHFAVIETSIADMDVSDTLDAINAAIDDLEDEIGDARGTEQTLNARLTNLENREVGSKVSIISSGNLPITGESDTDYYLLENGSYIHYRWINNQWEAVSSDTSSLSEDIANISNDVSTLSSTVSTLNSSVSGVNSRVSALENQTLVEDITKGQAAGSFIVSYNNENVADKTITLDLSQETTVRSVVQDIEDQTKLTVTYTDDSVETINLPQGGGGTSSGVLQFEYITSNNIDLVYGDSHSIQYRIVAKDSDGYDLSNGTATWFVGGIRKTTSTAANNAINSFDITPYLIPGENKVKVTIAVENGDSVLTTTKNWTINVINFYLEWDYNEATINDGDNFTLQWIPYGAGISKTTHIKIDNVEVGTSSTIQSGQPSTKVISTETLTHGSHKCELYMTATVNGQNITSTSVIHDLIIAKANNNNPIIACSLDTATMEQYDTLRIPIVIYTPNQATSTATLAVNGDNIAEWTGVDNSIQYWNYTPSTEGTKTLTITSGTTVKTITIVVTAVDIENEEVEGYNFKLKASELAGNNALQAWHYNNATPSTTSLIFSNNFDWVNGGIKTETDEDGNIRQFICVKSGTTMTIPYKMFQSESAAGRNFKMIFKVTNCSNYDAKILDCYNDNVGIEMFAHSASLHATGNEVITHYGEDSYTELEFEIYRRNTTNGEAANNSYMMCWIDGVITSARVYSETDSFVQSTPQNIVIGSNYCDVYVYLVKVYPSVLTFDAHIANFIADAPNASEMKKRYRRNDILDVTGEISYEKLVENNPDCRVWLYEIPYLTNSKDNKVSDCNFQQFWKNGDSYSNGLSGVGTMSIQGTSSVNYIRGTANTDINFTSLYDGSGNNLLTNGTKDSTYGNNWYVEDSENPGHAKVFVKGTEELTSDCVPVEKDANGNVTKYIKALGLKLNNDSCPITYANTKVNFASCEQVNNMCNAAWYQRFNPYPSLTARDCMEFTMGVQFIQETDALPDTSHFRVFPIDGKYHMYSIANFGNSKKNVHIFHDLTNENEVCIEVNDNDKDQMRMVSDDLTEEDWSGKKFFGMRYPDTKNPSQEIRDAWQRLVSWMASRNPGAATNEPLSSPETFTDYTFVGHNRPGTQVLRGVTITQYSGTYTTDSFEYRMAKMLSECENYMVMDSFVYHYLYLERHTMVDNVSKNNFWSSTDLLHWDLSKAYDMDTSDGNNNQGQLVFDYGNEFDDMINNSPVFNGSDSVWFVFVANLREACQAMFTNRESLGAWSAINYHNFLLSEQQKVPERCWNQTYWYNYLRTHEDGINDAWMTFLDGGQKTHQREHYEYFEELYDASKYRGAASTSQAVNFRAYTPSEWAGVEPKGEVTVSMYNKMYITVDSGTTLLAPIKAQRATPVVIDFSNQGIIGNTLIRINTASMIQTISGLEQLYSDTYDFSSAIRLRELTIGSLATGYQNTQLSDSLGLNNNKMLEYLYIQNLPNANFPLVLTGCPSLKYVDARGSGFTGYSFAQGAALEEAYLEKPTAISMRDLPYITNAKFNIIDDSALTSVRIENCPQFNTLSFIQSVSSSLNTVRLVGIDWVDANTLTSTDLLNALLRMRGITEDGITIVNEITSENRHGGSVLIGEAAIDGVIRSQEIEDYNNAWENLILHYNSEDVIPQYRVTFQNDDDEHTELYYEYVDAGGVPSDPEATGLIDTPTKASTAEYTYTFSGWVGLNSSQTIDTPIYEPTTYVATYTSAVRTYTVTWYATAGEILKQVTNVPYGTELVYEDSTHDAIPTYSGSTQSGYRLFSGWDKSTGRITGDTNVYAVWERGTSPGASYFEDENNTLNDLSPAEIYAYAYQTLGTKNAPIKSYKDVQLGHDFSFLPNDGQPYLPGHVRQTILCENYLLDGTAAKTLTFDEIKPLQDNGPFTIMIDYKLQETGSGTLLSCFENENNTQRGFQLRYAPSGDVTKASVQWETTSQNMGYCDGPDSTGVNKYFRNILVLRHEAGSKNLKCYCDSRGDSGVSASYKAEISMYEFNGLNNQTIDASLIVGATSSGSRGKGMIYIAKIWYDDLGDANCRQLANWPHQTVRLEYVGSNLYDNANYQDQTVKMTFNANNLLGQLGYPMTNSANADTYVWSNTLMKTFCNTRVFKAFPTVWQAMIAKSIIPVRSSTQMGYDNNEDYIHLPSIYEVNSSLTVARYSERGYISWMNDNGAHLEGNVYPTDASINATFSRIKFNDLIVEDDARYLKYYQNPFYLSISGVSQLKTGDIWLKTQNATNDSVSNVFYYISESDLTTNPKYYNMPIYTGSNSEVNYECINNNLRQGGWVPASMPWYSLTAIAERNGFYSTYANGSISEYSASATSIYGIDIMLSL